MITRQLKAIEALEQQLAEERQKPTEERELFAAIIAEEQRKAAEERRQLLALVESIRERHNGSNGQSQQ